VLFADQPEVARLDRPGVLLAGREQPGIGGMIGLAGTEIAGERRPRRADLVEHRFLLGAPAQTAKLADELAHRALAAELLIAGNVRAHVPIEPRQIVLMRAGRLARPPFLPVGLGRPPLDPTRAIPLSGDRHVRVEPGDPLVPYGSGSIAWASHRYRGRRQTSLRP
jgi:hypothetical protein